MPLVWMRRRLCETRWNDPWLPPGLHRQKWSSENGLVWRGFLPSRCLCDAHDGVTPLVLKVLKSYVRLARGCHVQGRTAVDRRIMKAGVSTEQSVEYGPVAGIDYSIWASLLARVAVARSPSKLTISE